MATPVVSQRTREWLLRAVRLLVIGVVALLSFYAFLERERLAEWATLGYLGVFVVNLIGNATVLVPVPSPLATIVGATIYHPLLVGLVSGTGAAIGEMSAYLTGRAGSFTVENRRLYQYLEARMRRHPWLVIFIFAFVPNPFVDLTGLLAGAFRLPVRYYFPVMWLGKLLKGCLLAYLSIGALSHLTAAFPWVAP